MAKGRYQRRCRECSRTTLLSSLTADCPHCGSSYGPIALGLDRDLGVAKDMDRVRQADADAAYRAFLDEKPRPEVADEP